MKTKAKDKAAKVERLDATTRSKIGKRLGDAWKAASEYGMQVVESFCKDFPRIDGISAEDLTIIVSPIAKARGWKKNTAEVRKSECKALILQAGNLKPACESFLKKTGHINWHDAVRLARKLQASKGNVSKAVTAATKDNDSKPKGPKGKCIAALKRIMHLRGLAKEIKDDVLRLAKKHNLEVA